MARTPVQSKTLRRPQRTRSRAEMLLLEEPSVVSGD